jgi:hypothetical protein
MSLIINRWNFLLSKPIFEKIKKRSCHEFTHEDQSLCILWNTLIVVGPYPCGHVYIINHAQFTILKLFGRKNWKFLIKHFKPTAYG